MRCHSLDLLVLHVTTTMTSMTTMRPASTVARLLANQETLRTGRALLYATLCAQKSACTKRAQGIQGGANNEGAQERFNTKANASS